MAKLGERVYTIIWYNITITTKRSRQAIAEQQQTQEGFFISLQEIKPFLNPL